MTGNAVPLSRDTKVMGLVGLAHASSHYYHLVLPPLFPILRSEFDVGYAALGALPSLFAAVSGVMQMVSGFLVDQFGARRLLLLGLTLLSLSVLGFGLVTDFWMLFPLAILAGVGNSVFHPADLAILTARVSPGRLGLGYASHALAGNLGWATAPVAIVGMTHMVGWRAALIVSGLAGIAVVISLVLCGSNLSDCADPERRTVSATSGVGNIRDNISLFFNATIISCLLYFVFLGMALVGVQTFAVSSLIQLYEISLAGATSGLTAFLIASTIGVICGGFAANQTDRHDRIATTGMGLAAVAFVCIGGNMITAGLLMPFFAFAGFVAGMTSPSRDMIVRKVAPDGASGRVFGFVYSGLDLGSALIPLLLGVILDYGAPDMVFYAIALVFIITAFTIRFVKPRPSQGTLSSR